MLRWAIRFENVKMSGIIWSYDDGEKYKHFHNLLQKYQCKQNSIVMICGPISRLVYFGLHLYAGCTYTIRLKRSWSKPSIYLNFDQASG